MAHSSTVLNHWDRLVHLVTSDNRENQVPLDGHSLDLASVVAVARYNGAVTLSEACLPRVEESVNYLRSRLAAGDTIYAVNTGVGGNADTRNTETVQLQKALLLHLNAGIVGWDGHSERQHYTASAHSAADIVDSSSANDIPGTQETPTATTLSADFDESKPVGVASEHAVKGRSLMDLLRRTASPASTASLESTSMPEPWVKAAILVRGNSLASGNSGISVELLRSFVRLIQAEICPVVPLRGSISASGDLQPLSYVVGTLAGSPGIKVWRRDACGSSARSIVSADRALEQAGLTPSEFGPKEVISIVNGTAFSAGPAALALHDGHCFAALTQVLTAMAVEALQGTHESFLPFFGQVRPHPGQIESANNILGFLQGSQMLKSETSSWEAGNQRQDRYALRTAAQWIGPSLEELGRAHSQVVTECNSTTDNPLVDAAGGHILHGGNFQAMAVTSAMDTLRSALQVWGRMLFAQLTELINPMYSNGLPPNLTAEDPSRDFLMKGMDTASAGYTSELGFLAQRMTPHVMSAEMHNQSINSLALLSARYTFMALDVFNTLAATALVAHCQALDLRAIHLRFLAKFAPQFRAATANVIRSNWAALDPHATVESLWVLFQRELARVTELDIAARFEVVMGRALAALYTSLGAPSTFQSTPSPGSLPPTSSHAVSDLNSQSLHTQWSILAGTASSAWLEARDTHTADRTLPLLGAASKHMYAFVRQDLQIPFLRATMSTQPKDPVLLATTPDATIGSFISRVFDAAKDGSLFVPVMECLRVANRSAGMGAVETDTKLTSDGTIWGDKAHPKPVVSAVEEAAVTVGDSVSLHGLDGGAALASEASNATAPEAPKGDEVLAPEILNGGVA